MFKNLNTMTKLLVVGIAVVVSLILFTWMFETLGADRIMVVQSPISGKLSWYTGTGGIQWQGFGSVTNYYKMDKYEFRIPVRFNDGGHGTVIGSINYNLPLDPASLSKLHTNFGSQDAIQKQLIETVVNKCVYMTGPLMSSKESYAEKRTSLINYIEDEIQNGVYKTVQKDVKVKDAITGAEKTATIVEICTGADGLPLRQEVSILSVYGIKTSNFAVTSLPYDETVENQIKQQQELAMKVQTAQASSKEAEQRSITVAKEGEANAAKAKWEQEVLKAKAVTEAQQQLEVARLGALAAEQTKRKLILEGEGEASKRRLIMQADGALEKKLEAWKEVQIAAWENIAKYPGAWVSQITMGDNGKGNGALTMMDILGVKAARDLGIDMSMKKQ